MKGSYLVVAWVLALAIIGVGCNGDSERQFRQEKRQFAIVMKSKLGQFEHKTDALSNEVAGDSLQTIAVEELRSEKRTFDDRISIIDSASSAEWKQIKPTLEAEYYDLERRYYEIASTAANRKASEAAADSLGADDLVPGTTAESGKASTAVEADPSEMLRGN